MYHILMERSEGSSCLLCHKIIDVVCLWLAQHAVKYPQKITLLKKVQDETTL